MSASRLDFVRRFLNKALIRKCSNAIERSRAEYPGERGHVTMFLWPPLIHYTALSPLELMMNRFLYRNRIVAVCTLQVEADLEWYRFTDINMELRTSLSLINSYSDLAWTLFQILFGLLLRQWRADREREGTTPFPHSFNIFLDFFNETLLCLVSSFTPSGLHSTFPSVS